MPTTPTEPPTPTSQPPLPPTDPIEAAAAAQALELLQSELLALDPDGLLPVNLDVAAAALVVIGAASKIRGHRAELVALCGEDMTKSIDRLELVARAALQAQATHRSIEIGVEVQALSVALGKIRQVLLAEARSLIARGVLAAGAIQEVSGSHGFKNQCVDVLQLVAALRAQWDVAGPQSGLRIEYLDQAEAAANALATAVGLRSQLARSPAADLRQRAYTLMARVYDRARRMIAFLRWDHGDAERIAPSLFRGRGNRRRRNGAPSTDAALPPATNDVAAPALPGAPPFTDA